MSQAEDNDASWDRFFAARVGASAALTGLLVIGISLTLFPSKEPTHNNGGAVEKPPHRS